MIVFALSALVLANQVAVAAPQPLPQQAATQQAAPQQPVQSIETKEVAYSDLTEGRTDRAIATLQEQLAVDPNDPAVLINLGSAYAQRGDRARADQAYRAAVASSTRYSVELADGSWIDSRQAARIALLRLERAQTALLD